MTDQPTPARCTNPCIACITDESHDPAPTVPPAPAAPSTPVDPCHACGCPRRFDRHADGCPRRERYAAVLAAADGFGWDNLTAQYPHDVAEYRKGADAVIAVADAEQAAVRRERDLAIAHDRQPYPTTWAYEQACKTLRRKTDAIERGLAFAASLDDIARKVAGPDAVHPVAAHIRHLLDTTVDEAQQAEPTRHELAPMFEGLARLLATSSRDWQPYRVDAWLYAVLVGWDCEQAEHDDSCTHGALEETAAMHGWDADTVAKARRYRAAVRAITEGQQP